jgi:hypothetical protein
MAHSFARDDDLYDYEDFNFHNYVLEFTGGWVRMSSIINDLLAQTGHMF